MGFRKNFFGVLALLSLAFMCYGVVGGAATFGTALQTPIPTTETLNAEEAQEQAEATAVIATGITSTFTICVGLPFFLIFALLAWRNAAGQRTERRHQELIAVQKGG